MLPATDKKIAQLRNAIRTGKGKPVIRALLDLSEIYNLQRDKLAFNYARQALEASIKNDEKMLIARAHLMLAIYFCRGRNDYTTSLNHCEKALQFKATLETRRELSEVFKTMGVNYYYLTELQKAQESYSNALDILLSNTQNSKEELKDIADLYYNLAILNRSKENIHLRKEYLEQAVKYYQQINSQSGIGRCYDGVAVYYFYTGQYKKALEQLQSALKIFEAAKDTEGIYLSSNNIGTLKIKLGKFQEGLDYLNRSLQLRKKGRNPVSIAISHINIGNALSDKKRHTEALDSLKQAEKILRKTKSKIELASLLSGMSACYKNLKQYQLALACELEHGQLREELHHYEMEKAYKNSIVRYDIELTEKNAVIDRLKNFELASYIHRLEMSNTELKQFAHAASHDLKEPLRTINSFINLLQKHMDSKLDATGREYIQYITGATRRLDELVKDILNLSQINLSEAPLSEVDLNTVFKDVVLSIATLVGERNVHFKCSKLPLIIADQSQMFQLFQNLIVNGIKYNESAQPLIKISARKTASQVVLSFADNGIGIPEEYQTKVFELFQRLHPREKYSGTGIGLTLCKKIVDRHRGKIWVEKNKPNGSVFKVALPQ
jgi:signal transduction histidine kinase